MIFNCLNCGISISSRAEHCPHCKANTAEILEHLHGKSSKKEYLAWKEKIKGSILAMVAR